MSLLILGGTGEARALSIALQDLPGARVSLAGVTERPAAQGMPARRGGFGGAEGFAAYLRSEGISAVLDATHPFAARMSARSRRVCDQFRIPYRRLLRPAWHPGAEDHWIIVPSPAMAVKFIPPGAVVFLATGGQSVGEYAGLDHATVLIRVIDVPEGDFPFTRGKFLQGRPPYDAEAETALFLREAVTHLICKNAGGAAGQAKLMAARALGVPVVMIARPEGPKDRALETVEAACAWVREGCSP
ncbi:MAG: cobalt-precorrin-6A reductase [Mangrovicoccus sp.]|nr:cobalt-precorrin-6A reductase [Mangrovicoccus sp.]